MFETSRPVISPYRSASSRRVRLPGSVVGPTRKLAERLRVVRLDPVAERRAQVHERVADRGHLPVEHGDDPRQVVGVEHQVVELVIIVDQCRTRLARPVRRQPGRGPFQAGDFVGPGISVAPGPARHLALDVALRLADVAQAGGP